MRTFQPFSEEIQVVAVPQRFREPLITAYNGFGDPQGLVTAFHTQMFISGGDDAISCKMFVGTLKDIALRWFIGLPPKSITDFEVLTGRFAAQFLDKPKKENRTVRLV